MTPLAAELRTVMLTPTGGVRFGRAAAFWLSVRRGRGGDWCCGVAKMAPSALADMVDGGLLVRIPESGTGTGRGQGAAY